MKIINISGNVLSSTARVIAHQVNCIGVMNAGLAKQVRNKSLHVYHSYLHYLETHENPMGDCQLVWVSDSLYIANLFAQKGVGRSKIQTNYNALISALESLKSQMIDKNLNTLAIPYKLGCGLGGGDWDIVHKEIFKVFGPTDITIEIWKLENN